MKSYFIRLIDISVSINHKQFSCPITLYTVCINCLIDLTLYMSYKEVVEKKLLVIVLKSLAFLISHLMICFYIITINNSYHLACAIGACFAI